MFIHSSDATADVTETNWWQVTEELFIVEGPGLDLENATRSETGSITDGTNAMPD